ncbi:MAG: hypothetical protein KatS3mg038_3390 [Candidatus Kapaibacterium sp.]|nr:MAG: hypothetical protein KatS3mg038_3390 [Candidatus Kapabacteria bacterium]
MTRRQHNDARSQGKWQGRRWIRDEKRLAIYLRDGLACVYCGRGVEHGVRLSLDHVVPHIHGGRNDAANLVTCCTECNSRRQDTHIRTWLRRVAAERCIAVEALSAYIRKQLRQPINVNEAKEMIKRRGGLTAALYN